MTEPVYFVVERCPGGEMPAIYRDLLPQRLTRKGAMGLDRKPLEAPTMIYCLRLDRLPDGLRLGSLPLSALYAHYCLLRDQGKLPASNLSDPPRKADPAKRLLGEFWEPPKRTWEDRPADPLPAPGSLTLRPDAGAFIGDE